MAKNRGASGPTGAEGKQSKLMLTCTYCKYWHREPGMKVGLCRRRAPTPQIQGGTRWPTTKSDDWCGDADWKDL